MSDSINGFTVLLNRDICEGQAERIKQAIELFPDVLEVVPNVVGGSECLTACCERQRLRHELFGEIVEIFQKER